MFAIYTGVAVQAPKLCGRKTGFGKPVAFADSSAVQVTKHGATFPRGGSSASWFLGELLWA